MNSKYYTTLSHLDWKNLIYKELAKIIFMEMNLKEISTMTFDLLQYSTIRCIFECTQKSSKYHLLQKEELQSWFLIICI